MTSDVLTAGHVCLLYDWKNGNSFDPNINSSYPR